MGVVDKGPALSDNGATVQRPQTDELALVRLYMEVSDVSEAQARNVVMYLLFRELRN